ncbi:MAG: Ig-like domain-containing protein, partial [Thiohalomonadales bacterium]|nr:Ig-like domain-containing protein [Thiohalomonadales bacterium]
GDNLTYAVTVQPEHGTLSGTPPALTYTPNENYNGSDSFSFKANDGQADGNTAAVNLNINPVNDVPVARAGSNQTVSVRDTVALNASASADIDGDSLSFSWVFIDVPDGSNAVLSDGSAVNPNFIPDLAGTYEVQLIVNDGEVDSSADQVVITANPRMVSVPEVVGLPQAGAEAALLEAGLVVGAIIFEHSETVPEGAVISQNPEAGVSVEENSAVDMTISLGPEIQPPTVSFSASPSSIEPGQSSSLSWNSQGAESVHIDHGIGAVAPDGSTIISPESTTTFTITVTGPTGSANAKVTVRVIASPERQPEGSYGEQYEDLVPEDATVEQYDPERFSLITGLVNDFHQQPLPEVMITILSHREYGSVLTDDEGRFSIPVEGGGILTVVYQKQGLISAQRKVYVPWNDNAVAETVVMIAEDPTATTLTFDGDADTVVTHKSKDVVDASGKRAVTMVFSGDNKAYLVDEDGNDVQELTTIITRATEYQTPEAMPAKLPPNSAFTYCAELSVDGVERVRFDKPVTAFIDNFLGFPVGSIVPVGYYDRDNGVWVPSENGVVVQLLDTDADGVVDALDADGDGLPDDLDGDGLFDNEIKGLGDNQRYTSGATFWRVKMKHFTPFDCNWPFGPPVDGIASNAEGMPVADQQNLNFFDTSAQQSLGDRQCIASYIEQRSRVFHEDIPIPGTDVTLHYTSSRVTGYKPGVITVPASGDTVPESLIKIIVQATVAGKKYEIELPPEPNQVAEIEWDGLDYLGRTVNDSAVAHIGIGFVYYGLYFEPNSEGPAFGQTGTNSLTVPTRQEVTLWSDRTLRIIVGKGSIAEGWTISSQHHVNPIDPSVLYKGNGSIYQLDTNIITTVAGNENGGFSGDGGPATEASFSWIQDIALDNTGNLYLADHQNHRIRKVDTNGIVTTVAGNGYNNPFNYVNKVTVDDSGNIYVAAGWWLLGETVYKVAVDGNISAVVGGRPPIGALLVGISGLAVDNSGNLYISTVGDVNYPNEHRILKVDASGIVTTVAGTGKPGFSGDGGLAINAKLKYPRRIALD